MILSLLIASGSGLASYKALKRLKQKKQKNTLLLKQATHLSKTTPSETNLEDKKLNRHLSTSIGSLMTVGLGYTISPALLYVGIPLLLYNNYALLKSSIRMIKEEKRVATALVDIIPATLILITQHFFLNAILLIFYFAGRKILRKTEDHSKQNLMNIAGTQPRSVWIMVDGTELEIDFSELKKGDIILVNSGESIPVDGVVQQGLATVDQRMLTGESQPVTKEPEAQVFAGTICIEGQLHIEVTTTGKDTVAEQIVDILTKTSDFKSSILSYGERTIDKWAPISLGVSGLAFSTLGFGSGLAVLGASVGHQLRVTAPLSMLSFLNAAIEEGILIKDGRSLDILSSIDTVVFDKTGTLTQEQPHVGQVHAFNTSEDIVLQYAAAAEHKQSHPIALAIIQAAQDQALNIPNITHAKYEVGYGLKVTIDNKTVHVGSQRFMEKESIEMTSEHHALMGSAHDKGHSMILVAIDYQLAGAVELEPTIRPETKEVIEQLHQLGLGIYIISGDHTAPTKYLAEQLGIEHYFAETLPEDKAKLIKQLQQEGKKVCFVGDGINDSIALKQAHVSISFSDASSVATDSAAIVLMHNNLFQLCRLFELATAFQNNMAKNLKLSSIPTLFSWGGVAAFHFSILVTNIIYQLSIVMGVTNALNPRLQPYTPPLLPVQKQKKQLPK